MKIYILIILLLTGGLNLQAQNDNDSIVEISSRLSELLIGRGEISDFQHSIKVKELFPEQELSKIKDSPAEFIYYLLYGAELMLPEVWSELLTQVDHLNLTRDAVYFGTQYVQNAKDSYTLVSVLKQSSEYFTFGSVFLKWDEKFYLARLFKKIKKYGSIEDLNENFSEIIEEEYLEEMKEIENLEEREPNVE